VASLLGKELLQRLVRLTTHKKTVNGKAYIHCPHHGDTKWVLKVNQQGFEHKTGCRMMAEANATGADRLIAAVANIEEEDDKEQI
jgi:hypothetical protein